MWKMADKNISRITYNHLNLPSKLEYGDFGVLGTTNYLYNASGIKLQKSTPKFECGIIDCYTTTETTDYLDGFQYQTKITTGNGGGSSELVSVLEKSDYAYEQQAYSIDDTTITEPGTGIGIIDPKNPNLMFFPTEEGFYDYQTNQYIYQYKDHLGNARLSFKRNSKGALQITDANDYYPFGMNHLKTGNAFLGSSYKNYKFLGKELQESGFYDLDARFYMPDIGRFTTHDPLSDSTLDPYGYAYNNPLFFTDATGLKSDMINTGEQITGPLGSGDSGGDPKPNELGGSNRPYQIPEIVVNAPIRAIASNPASIMPSYCSVCYSGNGTGSGINLSQTSAHPLSNNFYKPVLHNGSAQMMDSMVWDLLGILAANYMDSEDRTQALGLGALAIILTKGKAAPAIMKAEATGSYYSVAYEMKLAENLYPTGSYYAHFKAANTSLANALASDPKFAASISDLGIKIPTSASGSILGKSPKNWVWHHDVGTGIMQLAPKSQHTTGSIFWKTMHPDGLGGMKLWGLKSIK
ncbi:hypothetical protein DBR28_00170 [Chryseobacterium sp. HMWF028]|nr:hypothetical protein DBR28_00170 [Chryseobacterium sp. HMWF028]